LKLDRDEKDNLIQRTTGYLSEPETIQDTKHCPLNNAQCTNLDNEQSTIEEQCVASRQYPTVLSEQRLKINAKIYLSIARGCGAL
jgi:hypothetical protein